MPRSVQYSAARAAVALGLAARVTNAYTQVNIASPFMTKNIDPIVFPGQYDKSHMHSFFGSDAVTINTSTSAVLQEGCTNAENPNDLSVYCKEACSPGYQPVCASAHVIRGPYPPVYE